MRGRLHRLAILLGTVVISTVLIGGAVLSVQRTRRTALDAAETQVQRSALLARTIVNRQLVQVDSALSSLPLLFSSIEAPVTPRTAQRLLRGIDVQSFALSDLVLLARDGRVWTSARPRASRLPFPVGPAEIEAARTGFGQTSVIGPLRNQVTGEWVLFLARSVLLGEQGEMLAVAEVPLTSVMGLFGEGAPGLQVVLERGDGRLLASLPHDELAIGKKRPVLLSAIRSDGVAFPIPGGEAYGAQLGAAYPTLYGDVSVAAAVNLEQALAPWARDRDRLAVGVLLAELLILAASIGFLVASSRQERLEAERVRAQTILENAVAAMTDGFVMWDHDDRLITCNGRYRDLYAPSAPAIKPGATFEEVMRYGAAHGQYPQATGDVDAWLQGVVAWHHAADGSLERLLPDGRWLLVTERRTASGEIVGIRTDITALKTALTELEAANERARLAMEEARQQNLALQEREGQIAFLAHHDPLTSLANRALFRDHLEQLLRAPQRGGDVALLYLDLDKFKDVNDTLGHPVGDALLKAVGERLRGCLRESDVVARLGGDEFAVACSARDARRLAAELADRVIRTLSAPYDLDGRFVEIGTSIGIALAGEGPCDADTLGRNADMALYEAKAGGRGQCRFFEEAIEVRLQSRLDLERDLRAAVAAKGFELAYQPIYDLAAGRVRGFEALLRWHHPARGWVSPADFIPLAEQTRLIEEIGAFVLHQACADAATLPAGITVAVNLSPVQLRTDAICGLVAAALEHTGLAPERLELEITETAFVDDPAHAAAILARLKRLGTRLVLDDFGTGYSSLSYLRTFPLHKIKIDRSFVRDMATRADSAAIVTAVTSLADQLGMITTAEGIETPEHLDLVRRAGCAEAQGYFLGRPRPILNAFEALGRVLPPSPDASRKRA